MNVEAIMASIQEINDLIRKLTNAVGSFAAEDFVNEVAISAQIKVIRGEISKNPELKEKGKEQDLAAINAAFNAQVAEFEARKKGQRVAMPEQKIQDTKEAKAMLAAIDTLVAEIEKSKDYTTDEKILGTDQKRFKTRELHETLKAAQTTMKDEKVSPRDFIEAAEKAGNRLALACGDKEVSGARGFFASLKTDDKDHPPIKEILNKHQKANTANTEILYKANDLRTRFKIPRLGGG